MPDKRFAEPPIVEVVCGVSFDAIAEFDPVAAGLFWDSQKAAFPKKQVLPAIQAVPADAFILDLSPLPPLRTWLISTNDTRVMQLQAERFFLNWRARDSAYPSFNPEGDQRGLLAEADAAFTAFGSFVEAQQGTQLRVTSVEVTMIDVFVRGRHWADAPDLARLLPSLSPFSPGIPSVLQVVSETPFGAGVRRVTLQRVALASGGEAAIRFESTVRLPSERETVQARWREAHATLKATFDEFVPPSEHHRFEKNWRPS